MNANKRIVINSVVIFLRLCIVSVIGIVASRIVLDALGASDFGLYNVVGGIVVMLNVVNTAMVSTTYRYIAYELGKPEEERNINKIFNTSFTIHVAFACLIVLLGVTVGLWYVTNYLNVESGKTDDAVFVLLISICTTALSTIMVPYQGLLVAYEKFNINAIIDILSCLFRIVLLLLFIYSDGDRLRTYSIIMLIYTCSYNFAYFIYCQWNYRKQIFLKLWRDIILYKEMLSYACWIVYGAFAYALKAQGSNLIINLFFGTLVNAAYAVANQIEGFIMSFSRSLNSAAIPQITKNVSGGDTTRSLTLASYISKYTFILMALAAFPVLLEMDFLLGLWLKEVPVGATTFCRLMVLGGLIDCLGEGISPLVNATGKIKNYVFVIHTVMLCGLPVAFVCYKIGCPPYTITIVFCAISLICSGLKIYLLHRILRFDIMLFLRTSYVRIFAMAIPLAIYYYFYNTDGMDIKYHIIYGVLSELFLLFVIAVLGTDKNERNKILGYVNARLKRK